jgi:hypothetical protein
MVWKDYIAQQFDHIDRSTTWKNDFYGAYFSLFHDLFPSTEHYRVIPQFRRDTGPGLVDYYTISYVVLKNTTLFSLSKSRHSWLLSLAALVPQRMPTCALDVSVSHLIVSLNLNSLAQAPWVLASPRMNIQQVITVSIPLVAVTALPLRRDGATT